MKPTPRIEVIRHRTCSGHKAELNFMRHGLAYSEDYETRIMRPNCPLFSRNGLTRQQADSLARQQLYKLRDEGYESAIFNGRIVSLK